MGSRAGRDDARKTSEIREPGNELGPALNSAYDRDPALSSCGSCFRRANSSSLKRELARYIREVVPTLPDKHAFYDDKSRPETLKQLQHMDVDPFFREY